jgi:hypothetical protein
LTNKPSGVPCNYHIAGRKAQKRKPDLAIRLFYCTNFLAVVNHFVVQIIEGPKAVGNFGHHGGGRAEFASLAALVAVASTPNEIVVSDEHRTGGGVVVQFLGEGIGEASKSLHKRADGSIVPLYLRGADRPFVALEAPYRLTLGSDHFGRRIGHLGVLVLLYDDAVIGEGAERQVNRFWIARKTIRADLSDGIVAARVGS